MPRGRGSDPKDADLRARRSRPYRSPSRVIGLIGTLLLHAVILPSVLLGSHRQNVRSPDAQGPGATLIQSVHEPRESLVLIDIPTVDMATKPLLEDLASAGSAAKNPMVTVLSPDPLPHVEIPADSQDDVPDPPAAPDRGDPAARAVLFGRYSGQIQARVERAWRRPRSPVSDGGHLAQFPAAGAADGAQTDHSFRCQVRILQDPHGAVQEVQMLECNGSISWQQSLVTAILSASPLPVPPNPSVFTRALTMTFEAQAYSPGSLPDEYEIESMQSISEIGRFR